MLGCGGGVTEQLIQRVKLGTSLAVQWLGLCAFTAKGPGSVTGQGTEIPQATQHGQKQKRVKLAMIPAQLLLLLFLLTPLNPCIQSQGWASLVLFTDMERRPREV